MARMNPVMIPGEAMGSSTRSSVWNFVAPRAYEPSRKPRGIVRSASSVDDDHHRHGQQAQRQAGPEDAAGARTSACPPPPVPG